MENVNSTRLSGISIVTEKMALSMLVVSVVALIVHGFVFRGMVAVIILGSLCAIGLVCTVVAYVCQLSARNEIERLKLQLEAARERQQVQKSQDGSVVAADVHVIPVKLHLALSSQKVSL